MARSLSASLFRLSGITAQPMGRSLTLSSIAFSCRFSSSSGDLTSPPPPTTPAILRNLTSSSRRPIRRAPPPSFTGTVQDLVQKSRLYNLSVHRSLYPMRSSPRRKIKRIHLPTHYVEVSYKLRKAVVFYQPSIAHIPHGIKDRNPVLVTSGAKRGQNN